MGRHRAYPRDPMKRAARDIIFAALLESYGVMPQRYVLGCAAGWLTQEEIDQLPKVYI